MARDAQTLTYRVYSVIEKGEGQDDFWLPIGGAFAHQDGKGFNVILQALPIGNKIVLREPLPEDEKNPPAEDRGRNDNNRSERRNRR